MRDPGSILKIHDDTAATRAPRGTFWQTLLALRSPGLRKKMLKNQTARTNFTLDLFADSSRKSVPLMQRGARAHFRCWLAIFLGTWELHLSLSRIFTNKHITLLWCVIKFSAFIVVE